MEEQRWAGVLVVALAADGTLVLRPLLALGLFHFGKVLAATARLHCRRLLTQFGERVLEWEEAREEAHGQATAGAR